MTSITKEAVQDATAATAAGPAKAANALRPFAKNQGEDEDKNASLDDDGVAAAGATTTRPAITLDSVDFMNYLAREVDIARLVVETKDGQRISANFTGSRFGQATANGGAHPPPSIPVFKSLDALRSIDSTIVGTDDGGCGVNNNGDKSTRHSDCNGDKSLSTAEPQSYQQPLKGECGTTTNVVDAQTHPPMAPTPQPIQDSFSRFSSLGTVGGTWDPFTSSDWAKEYGGTHVEVRYSTAFDLESTDLRPGNAADGASDKTGPSASVNGMFLDPKFDNSLNPLLVAAARMAGQSDSGPPSTTAMGGMSRIGGIPIVSAAAAAAEPDNQTAENQCNKKKRKSRKIIPEVKEFVEFTDKDVLFGRGGRSNHHPGNKAYRDLVTSKQSHYKKCEKSEKTQVAQSIVDHIQSAFGGRFLELDKDTDRWYVVPHIVARRKVGQALREDNTEEARAAKRRKYVGQHRDGGGSEASFGSAGATAATTSI